MRSQTHVVWLLFMYNAFMISKSVEETAAEALRIAQSICKKATHKPSTATVLALSGDLGSGKTTFTKALAAVFGIRSDDVTSPTFVIMKSYDISASDLAIQGGFKKMIHIDAYRLESPVQVAQLGWKELVSDPFNLIVIEWPEKMGMEVFANAQRIDFTFIDKATREINTRF